MVMKAQHLRIGNLAKIRTSLAKAEIRETRALDIYLYNREEASIYPVELTEEWLLKFGFSKWKNKNNWTMGNFIVYTLSKQEGFFFGKKSLRTSLKYLHQLQNLYFAVTQQELEIN